MISFILPTIGRPTLARTLNSIQCWPGDEVIIVGQPGRVDIEGKHAQLLTCPPGGDWGNTERNVAMTVARNPYLAFIDDDDWYVPEARDLMEDAIERTPDQLVLFRMQFPSGLRLWGEPVLRSGNVGSPMILIPNDPARLGRWPLRVYEGDFGFLQQCRYEISWRPEVIAFIGRDIGQERQ